MDNENRPHVKPGPIKYTKGYGVRVLMRKLVNLVVTLFMLFIIAGSIYVFTKQPARTSTGYIEANVTHRLMQPGDEIFVIEDTNFNMFSPIKRFVIEHEVYRAKVVAGPYGEITKSQGIQKVKDGENVVVINIDKIEHEYLDEEYVVRKVDIDGNFIGVELDSIIDKSKILGTVN